MQQSVPSPGTIPVAIPTKRKRSSQACGNCRTAKRKCDSARPVCGACKNSSVVRICGYDDPQEAKAKHSKMLERLQQRIIDLERAGGERERASVASSEVRRTELGGSHSTTLASTTQNCASLDAVADNNGHTATSSLQDDDFHHAPDRHFNITSSSEAPSAPSQPSRGQGENGMYNAPLFNPDLGPPTASGSTVHSQTSDPNRGHVTFEHGPTYQDQDQDLPPNVEIGVVAPRFGYFGDSSAVTFMSQVRSVLDSADDGEDQYETEPTSPAYLPHEPSAGYQEQPDVRRLHAKRRCVDLELYALPSREHADALLEIFWTWVHSLYPYLDRPDFEQKYEKIWLAPKKFDGISRPAPHPTKQFHLQAERSTLAEIGDRKTFYCTLNIVFALSCQFDPALNPAESSLSHVFWHRAKTLIEQDFNIFNEGSVSLIQALLLFGVYMQSTELSGGCWTVANVATSVAQINGLHQINLGVFDGTLSPKELDLRKRVWSGCILLDRSLSMIYGRPSIMTSRTWVADDFISIPSPVRPVPASGGGNLSYSEFFHHHSTLHDILGAILAEFYEKTPTSTENTAVPASTANASRANTFRAPVFIRRVNEGDFQSLLRFDTALLRWKSHLPANLNQSIENDTGNTNSDASTFCPDREITQQQAAVLHARYLYIRILLFRPLLLRTLADHRKQAHDESGAEEKSTLHELLLTQSSVLCISAAQELSKIISKNLERQHTRLPEWWHIIFYLYTCATVVLASRCCPPLRERIGEDALRVCWAESLNGLRSYQRCSRSARRCCRLLEMFDQRTQNRQPSSRQTSGSELTATALTEARQATTRTADIIDDLNLPHAPIGTEIQNPWPFDAFHTSQPVTSLDMYFNSWTPNSTDMAFLAAIPFDSGLYPA